MRDGKSLVWGCKYCSKHSDESDDLHRRKKKFWGGYKSVGASWFKTFVYNSFSRNHSRDYRGCPKERLDLSHGNSHKCRGGFDILSYVPLENGKSVKNKRIQKRGNEVG